MEILHAKSMKVINALRADRDEVYRKLLGRIACT